MYRKIMSVLLISSMVLFAFAGCNASKNNASSDLAIQNEQVKTPAIEPEEIEDLNSTTDTASDTDILLGNDETNTGAIRVAAMKGPTAMGMVKLMQDAEDGVLEGSYLFDITSMDDIVAKISKGELDIAAVPANLASTLYSNTQGKVQVAAINTLGVIYMVSRDSSITSVADLKGKTIYATGKGATPELAFNYVLGQHGLKPETDMTVEFKAEAAEIIPLLMNDETAVALLPQPFATVAQEKIDGLEIVLDWTKEWDAVANGQSSLLTGVLIVRTDFAAEHPEQVNYFLEKYKESTLYATSNISETAALIGKYDIVEAAIAEKALPACNIVYIDGDEMQATLAGYLSVLNEQNPQSIGGSGLPDELFYYKQAESTD